MTKKVVFSGIQPTGLLQLGNYIGAIHNWVALQNNMEYKNIYTIVDLHAITIFQNPKELRDNILKLASFLIACGIDPDKSILFAQSSNPNHTELAWLLNCSARIGWLNRMTQFKDKSAKGGSEASSVGLYTYPVLQAADILLYDTDIVPIGEDQKQHIELARDIAMRFNRDYKKDVFKIPEPQIIKERARIMSLKDATKKMSKSDENDNSKILLNDTNDVIAKKIAKATTDSFNMPTSLEEAKGRAEIYNLITIYGFASNQAIEVVIAEFAGQGFANFKSKLTESLIAMLSPIREKQEKLYANLDYLKQLLHKGSLDSYSISSKKMSIIKEEIGFII